MHTSSLNIIHGMSEVAGQGINTVTGLRNNGISANMAVWRKNSIGYDTDIDIKIGHNKLLYPIYMLKMLKFALYAWKKYNVLHSHYGHSLLPWGMDLNHDKRANIKIFAEFHGSELRGAYNDIKYEYFSTEALKENRVKRQNALNKLIKYSDGIVLHDMELVPHLPAGLSIPVYIVPLRVDIKKFNPVYYSNNSKPIIVHAPSRRTTKGTENILKALETLKEDYELVLVEGKTQEEAFEIYKKADIIIDQISLGTYGVFAIEAMALGKPVITYISDDIRETFPSDLPIISADFDTLPRVIDELLVNTEKRIEIGKAGREYAERYHDNNKVAKYLAKIYDGTITENNLFNVL